jgi:hypothetical protein
MNNADLVFYCHMRVRYTRKSVPELNPTIVKQ